mmetsp:Transcript_71322/g.160132  ORF Transcript_71322/g.160132 Transcript_71322/m.160132 type:complete len:466 (-) Transcript_71322:2-1399(-)
MLESEDEAELLVLGTADRGAGSSVAEASAGTGRRAVLHRSCVLVAACAGLLLAAALSPIAFLAVARRPAPPALHHAGRDSMVNLRSGGFTTSQASLGPTTSTSTWTTTHWTWTSTTTASVTTCAPPVDVNTNYLTKEALYQIDHITTPEACRILCESEVLCAAWTWAAFSSLNTVCFLKKLLEGEQIQKQWHRGWISGSLPQNCHSVADGFPKQYETDHIPNSLFCFVVMQPHTFELKLVALQHQKRASLFACDKYKVYSNMSIEIAKGFYTSVVHANLYCPKGGEFGTVLNLDVFIRIWRKVISDGDYLHHGWTVKADPDTVFFPTRLYAIVSKRHEAPNGIYLNNCRFGLHGPLEVLSRNAVRAWGKGIAPCLRFFKRLCSGDCKWGEDMFMDQCFVRVLAVKRDDIANLLTEEHCSPPKGWDSCEDRSQVAFHPFKSVEGYRKCFEQGSSISTHNGTVLSHL